MLALIPLLVKRRSAATSCCHMLLSSAMLRLQPTVHHRALPDNLQDFFNVQPNRSVKFSNSNVDVYGVIYDRRVDKQVARSSNGKA